MVNAPRYIELQLSIKFYKLGVIKIKQRYNTRFAAETEMMDYILDRQTIQLNTHKYISTHTIGGKFYVSLILYFLLDTFVKHY